MTRVARFSIALASVLVVLCATTLWAQTAASDAAADPRKTMINNLNLENSPVRAAINLLFEYVPQLNVAISPDVEGYISVKLSNVTFEEALRTICRINIPQLQSRKDGNTYTISVKKAADTAALVTPGVETAVTEEEPLVERRVQKISLNFTSASDIGAIFGATIATSRANQFTMGGGGGYGGSYGSGGFGNSGGFGSSFGGSSYGGSGFGSGGFGGGMSGFGGSSYGGGGYNRGGFGSSYGSSYGRGGF